VALETSRLAPSASLLDEAFAPGEVQRFRDVGFSPASGVCLAWTLKEAALKVWGVGARVPGNKMQLLPKDPVLDGVCLRLQFRAMVDELPPGVGSPPGDLEALVMPLQGERILVLAARVGGSAPRRGPSPPRHPQDG
jgi:hypothetical protein